jgi:hypothetical protein
MYSNHNMIYLRTTEFVPFVCHGLHRNRFQILCAVSSLRSVLKLYKQQNFWLSGSNGGTNTKADTLRQ